MMYGFSLLYSCLPWFLMLLEYTHQTLTRGLGSEDEVRLVKDLFEKRGYNPLIRPVQNANDTITVEFNLALSQLINVDEKNQIMKTNVWLQMYWYDYQLKWNKDDYGGIEGIRIHHEKAWRPDIVLFNNADGNYEVSYLPNVVISHTGDLYQIPPAIYKSSCTIEVEYFPFDQQECEMKFASWTYNAKQMNYKFYGPNTLDVTDYFISGTWDIIDCPGRIENFSKEGTNEEQTMVIFKFVLRRKTLFYIVNLIIPCILISFVSVCVFALPADAGEKITLCISILLSLVVFLLLISKMLPPSLEIPLISKYLLFTFIMNIISIIATVVIINRNYRTPRTHSMPKWVRLIFLRYLPLLLFMKRPDHSERSKKPSEKCKKSLQSLIDPDLNRVSQTMSPDVLELVEIPHQNCILSTNVKSSEETESQDSEVLEDAIPFQMTQEIHDAVNAVHFITKHIEAEDVYDTVIEDWKFVASVLDRLLLYLFLIVTTFGSIGIIMKAPHLLQHVDQEVILAELRKMWAADGNYEVSYLPNVVMNYTGRQYWIPPAIYKSSCTIEVDYFPFDQQECEMKFASWTYNAKQLNYTFLYGINTLDVTDYFISGTWDIIDCPGRIESFPKEGTNEEQTMVIFKFVLRRKTLFYIVNFIIPCILISFVSVCVFALPADAGEKITLCISILLSLVVFLLLISKMLPPSLRIPLISKYLLFTFIMNIISIVATVVIINRNYRTPRTHSMPKWVRLVFLRYLPLILFMKRPNHSKRSKKPSEKCKKSLVSLLDPDSNVVTQHISPDVVDLTKVTCQNFILSKNVKLSEETESQDSDGIEDASPFKMTSEIRDAVNSVQFITKHIEAEDVYDTVIQDWKFVASVLDRLLLYLFLIVTTFGSIGIMMKAPHILQHVDQEVILAKLRKVWAS